MHRSLPLLLVMASLVAAGPAYASGSCLSYGHSCWGAHGKRSGAEGPRWALPRLVMPLGQRRSVGGQWPLGQGPAREEVQVDSFSDPESGVGSDEMAVVSGDEAAELGRPAEEATPEDDRQLILMEQTPRLYKIFNKLQRNGAGVRGPLK